MMRNKELTALEALNTIYDKYATDDDFLEDDKLFSTIEKALKVLEIIKEKEVCIYLFTGCDNVKQYNNSMDLFEMPKKDRHKYHLTQEQFDLLKEVLSL